MKRLYLFLLLISSGKLVSAQTAAANVDSIHTDKIPKAVIEAFRKLAPNSVDITYWLQRSEINPYEADMDYGFEFIIPSGSSVPVGKEGARGGSALFSSIGYLRAYRIPIQMDSLPTSVRKAFIKNTRRRRYIRCATGGKWIKELIAPNKILEPNTPDKIMYSGEYYSNLMEGCGGVSIYKIVIDSRGNVKMHSEECP